MNILSVKIGQAYIILLSEHNITASPSHVSEVNIKSSKSLYDCTVVLTLSMVLPAINCEH